MLEVEMSLNLLPLLLSVTSGFNLGEGAKPDVDRFTELQAWLDLGV